MVVYGFNLVTHLGILHLLDSSTSFHKEGISRVEFVLRHFSKCTESSSNIENK